MAADNYEIDVTLDQIFGTGISSVEQTVESHEPNGVNEITVTLTNGQTSVFNVRNGDSSGKPTPVATVAEMTDTSEIYLYTGNEEGYVKGNIYCYEGGEWTDVGTYGGMIVDEALDADSENAVTNKAITSAIQTLNNKVNSKPDVASGGNKTIIIGEVDQDPPSGVYVPTVGLTGALSSLTTTNKNSLTGAINEVKADVNALIAAVGSPLVASTVAGMTDQTKIYVYTGSETGYTSGHWYYYDGSAWADGGIYQSTGIDTDKTLTVENQAADGKAVGDEITALKSAIEQGSGLTSAIKSALLQIAQKVAYIDEDGQDYYDDLYDALYPPVVYTAITLNTNSLSFGALNTTQTLIATTTPSGGAVTWSSSDASVATVSQTGVVTSVGYGNATITATCGSLSATCSVAITQATVTSISANYTQGSTVVYDTDSLDVLKSGLVVTANWSNGTTSTVASADYTLSGTLTVGTSTITASYGGQSATFTVTVTDGSILSITQGNLSTASSDTDRVSVVYNTTTFSAGAVMTFTAVEGYQIYVFGMYGTSNDELVGTARGTNSIYCKAVTSTGVTYSGVNVQQRLTFTAGWETTKTITCTATDFSIDCKGYAIMIKSTDGSALTPEQARSVFTKTLVG